MEIFYHQIFLIYCDWISQTSLECFPQQTFEIGIFKYYVFTPKFYPTFYIIRKYSSLEFPLKYHRLLREGREEDKLKTYKPLEQFVSVEENKSQ